MTFNPGQNSKTVTIKVHPDSHDEPNEVVTVTLSNPVGATIADAAGTLTILDDD
jgi:chitinase